jgi:hypothetical protein
VTFLSFAPSSTARRLLFILFCAALGLLQLGCAVRALNDDDARIHGRDQVVSFLTTKDAQKIVIVGQKYHYVLDGEPTLRSVLGWEGRAKLTPDFSGEFKVARDQSLEGHYSLRAFEADLTPADQSFLTQAGFSKFDVKFGARKGPALRYAGTFKGTRYEAKQLKPADTVAFSKPYYVNYVEQESAGRAATKAALTPLAYAADGTLVLGGVVVFIAEGVSGVNCQSSFINFCFFK